jgi:hypothetical protein
LGSSKPEVFGNPRKVRLAAVIKSLKESYKGSMTFPRGIAGSPKVSLAEFLRAHLQVVELMARIGTLPAQ